MKTTVKEFEAKIAERRNLNRYAQVCEDNQDWSMEHAVKISVNQLNENYFDKLETVCVKFFIGYGRKYYREVYKIGKWYFTNGMKMTKGNGYRGIEEIPAITEKMTQEMIEDSYCY